MTKWKVIGIMANEVYDYLKELGSSKCYFVDVSWNINSPEVAGFTAIMDKDVYDSIEFKFGVEQFQAIWDAEWTFEEDEEPELRYVEHPLAYISETLDARTVLEQLAEESAELAQAALKCLRANKFNNNVTTMSAEDSFQNLIEEFEDVLMNIGMIISFNDVSALASNALYNPKWDRWKQRLQEAHEPSKENEEVQEKHSA